MRVLLGQMHPVPGDPGANVAAIAQALAAHPDADLAVFPELAVAGYDLPRARELAVPAGDPSLDPLRAAADAHGTAVIVGFAERTGAGAVRNAAACIGADGAWRATYAKVQLFGGVERDVFEPGDELLVLELAGRRVAPLICFDVEFPEPARAVAEAGAELLVTIAANPAPYGRDHARAIVARAQDNRSPHVYVNQCGEHAGLRFVGESAAVDAGGELLTRLGDGPAAATADVAFEAPRPDVDYLRLRRPTPPVRTVNCTTLERTT